jgi:hypothetical protein
MGGSASDALRAKSGTFVNASSNLRHVFKFITEVYDNCFMDLILDDIVGVKYRDNPRQYFLAALESTACPLQRGLKSLLAKIYRSIGRNSRKIIL